MGSEPTYGGHTLVDIRWAMHECGEDARRGPPTPEATERARKMATMLIQAALDLVEAAAERDALLARAQQAEADAARLRAAAERVVRAQRRLLECVAEFEPEHEGVCYEWAEAVDTAIDALGAALAGTEARDANG